MLQQVTVDARVTFASMRIAVDARCSNVPDATVLPRKNRGKISMWPTESEDQVQCYQGGNAWCTPFRLLSFHSYAQTHAGALHSHEHWILRNNRAESVATMLYQKHRCRSIVLHRAVLALPKARCVSHVIVAAIVCLLTRVDVKRIRWGSHTIDHT